MKTLTIRLTAPLQSYGNEASFGRRTANPYPTKSAVIGMIAAASGYRRDDERTAELNDLSFAVRIDQPGQTMNDFQIVEYAKSPTKKAKKLTYRSYLQDAVFMVAIGSDNKTIDEIVYALQHPKFALFLGRRSNPPAGPLILQTYENKSPLEVLRSLDWQASKWYQDRFMSDTFRAEIVYDSSLDKESSPSFQIKDKVGSFNSKNRFHTYREVASSYVLVKNKSKLPHETDQDVMANI
ncbi:type I-E CRISPR-associated protein Cas5/CasD [uncultured Lactobacillus sp.]|uniref:type I-E CRISPR-associated protein Cas5/CasD n=1 Tax=uncultured Lactobacillus sp. TaxID=153152 RepID=UPI0026114A36|nr:type I-E CRISPR-associated protein Cas5/CasD [uncultured Lactobacillus sp.]